ncbi:dienelactone hydrolase family protein [Schlesneria paludicola]|uniref:dienelactone hydrolase family protein n=1 Tax=Schlesneria paludicola TaxID=360056 RepID=UPI00029A02D0|nr:dienelactone hydrolase family protein [Schlesneria paludicola]
MHRFLVCFVLSTATTFASDVSWLTDVQRPPATLPAPFRTLSPLLSDADLQAADALSRWKRRRVELLQAWHDVLGPMPKRPKSVAIETLRTEQLQGLTRKLIRYENEPGLFLEAYLLQPVQGASLTRHAGLVALHATTNDTIEPIAGVKGDDAEQLGLKLARQGFVVVCPRNFLWQDATSLNDAVAKFRERYPRTLGMHKMLYDAQRATDILAALPDVDRQRLGAVGHSLGAKEVLYLTAFDDRIAAAVSSEGGIAFNSTNWNAPWYLGPVINSDDFPRNHQELLALIAPRPFLVLGGESGPGAADGDRSWPYLAAAQPIYELYGRTVRLGLLNHREGHAISPKSFDQLAEWLRVYLNVPSP